MVGYSYANRPSFVHAYMSKSHNLFEYPHSLSYQEIILKNLLLISMHDLASTIEECGFPTMSKETIWSSVYPKNPFIDHSDAFLKAAKISFKEVSFLVRTTKSTTDPSAVGTRKAIPDNFPFNCGQTIPTAFAAPVEDGMMLFKIPLPLLHFFDGPSTVF